MTKPTLLTTPQVAERLGVSIDTVQRLARGGVLRPEIKFPGLRGASLFHPDEIARYEARKAEVDEAIRRLNDAV